MNLIDALLSNDIIKFKELVYEQLSSIAARKLEEEKKEIASAQFEVELEEGNIITTGRVQRIRRRIRRNKKGRITVQRNVRRSAIKGYKLSGNTVRRIPVQQKIHKARMLKRYWKTKGRSKLKRTLQKRKMSMRRRKSMGIK
jgi:hypothetical protein